MKIYYNKNGMPSVDQIMSDSWRNYTIAKYGVFGDSNVHLTNAPAMISIECLNDALGGSSPIYTEARLQYWINKLHEFKGIYIQTGGNFWGGEWKSSLTIDTSKYIEDMGRIINKAISLCERWDKIIIASLPFVSPIVDIADWPETANYPAYLKTFLSRVSANDLFEIANNELEKLCDKYGVIYYDVFNRLKMFWKAGYKKTLFYERQSYWWDSVHYANHIRELICNDIKKIWGI